MRGYATILFVALSIQACAGTLSPKERRPIKSGDWLIRFHKSCASPCQRAVLRELGLSISRRSSQHMVQVPRSGITREQLEQRPEIRAVSDNPVLYH